MAKYLLQFAQTTRGASQYIYKAILLATLMCLVGCTSDLCSNQVIKEKINSSKNYKLIYFDRDCGATTGNSNQLSVIPIDEELDDNHGNIFISESNSGSNSEIDREIVFEWLNDSSISVKYAKDLKIFKKENKVGPINIVYENIEVPQSNQINGEDIRSQVLTKNKIGHKYIFKMEDETTTQLKYLGILRTTKGAQYKIMNSVWRWGLNGNRATSRILVFSAGNQYLGNFPITIIDDLPTSIRNNSLEFTNKISIDCDPETVTSLSFNNGIPKEFFRKCKGNSGDVYIFEPE
ncbi:MAG: hypothetical protein V4594_09545 [Bacteroidota bacterium]